MTDTTESTTVETPKPEANQPSWYLDEKTPGQGDRPEWLPAKYKSAADLGKSYSELEKKLGAFTGAPEEYDLSSLEVDDSQLIVQEIKSVAKELNMSQDGLQKFLGRIATATETENQAHLEDQIKKLGKDGESALKEYENWTKNYFKPEEAEVVKTWIKTADDLTIFNKVMSTTNRSAMPTSQSMALANNHESIADLRKELTDNIGKFDTDKTYAKNWSARMAGAVAREHR